ncbi:MAG: TlpA family protein disulfide reductase [Candidatus Omnitrophica bacterium]|jgi:peroxiredoxin|nr:TlpA family protein disulfide reductase [Candidatus Omnitrophota bacterium]
MRIKKLTVSLVALFVLLSGVCFAQDFKLKDLKGQEVTLTSFKNQKPVLLLFWTTWCPYCRQALLDVNGKYPETSKGGLEILAINIGESREKVEKFVQLRDLKYPVLLDQQQTVVGSFMVYGIPAYIIIDKEGNIAARDNRYPDEQIKKILGVK